MFAAQPGTGHRTAVVSVVLSLAGIGTGTAAVLAYYQAIAILDIAALAAATPGVLGPPHRRKAPAARDVGALVDRDARRPTEGRSGVGNRRWQAENVQKFLRGEA